MTETEKKLLDIIFQLVDSPHGSDRHKKAVSDARWELSKAGYNLKVG